MTGLDSTKWNRRLRKIYLTVFLTSFIVAIIAASSTTSCNKVNSDGAIVVSKEYLNTAGYHIEIIDSCEYVSWSRHFTHKGNCKFCAERRKQEFKEILLEIQK